MARDRMDEALMIMISECEMSADDIFAEITQRVLDTFKYYDKPREELRRLLELFEQPSTSPNGVKSNSQLGEWNEFFQYDHILRCQELFGETNPVADESDMSQVAEYASEEVETYNLSDCSIQSSSYEAIVGLFQKAFNRDIRSYSFDVNLVSSDGMDILAAELIELWNDYVVPFIVSTVNENLASEEKALGIDNIDSSTFNVEIINPRTYERRSAARGNKYDVYHHFNHIPTFQSADDFVHIRTLFDLIHAYEQALEDHREYVNLIEKCDY